MRNRRAYGEDTTRPGAVSRLFLAAAASALDFRRRVVYRGRGAEAPSRGQCAGAQDADDPPTPLLPWTPRLAGPGRVRAGVRGHPGRRAVPEQPRPRRAGHVRHRLHVLGQAAVRPLRQLPLHRAGRGGQGGRLLRGDRRGQDRRRRAPPGRGGPDRHRPRESDLGQPGQGGRRVGRRLQDWPAGPQHGRRGQPRLPPPVHPLPPPRLRGRDRQHQLQGNPRLPPRPVRARHLQGRRPGGEEGVAGRPPARPLGAARPAQERGPARHPDGQGDVSAGRGDFAGR